jgi:riboflavin kinase / FMN adenylyltransferase
MTDGAVITVGTFDGVHRGHWRVLETLVAEAHRRELRAVLVTFEPHPLRVVRPDAAPPLLSSRAEKIEVLAQFGIDRVAVLTFDARLAALPPRRFIEDVLIARFGLHCLVMGYDHGFGRDRAGDIATIESIRAELGFDVVVVPPRELAEHPISSTRIRQALAAGDVESAARALGRPYGLRGTVVTGDGLGRELGFPTANIQPDEPAKLLPAEGIYAVRVFCGRERYDGLLHLGKRPTFADASPRIEVHLLDFAGELYDRTLDIRFCRRLREVERFDTAAALVAAMMRDVAAGRAVFAAGAGACSQAADPLQ